MAAPFGIKLRTLYAIEISIYFFISTCEIELTG